MTIGFTALGTHVYIFFHLNMDIKSQNYLYMAIKYIFFNVPKMGTLDTQGHNSYRI